MCCPPTPLRGKRVLALPVGAVSVLVRSFTTQDCEAAGTPRLSRSSSGDYDAIYRPTSIVGRPMTLLEGNN